MKKLIVIALMFVTLVLTKDSFSQITGSINAKGTVLAPIAIATKNDLNFGTTILPGVNVTVNKTDATNGGRFSLTGVASKQISILFTLPATLANGSYTMPISFSTTDAATKITTGSYVAFDPASTTNANFGTDSKLDVVLGGTVAPSHTQNAGNYTATVSISLAYTGN